MAPTDSSRATDLITHVPGTLSCSPCTSRSSHSCRLIRVLWVQCSYRLLCSSHAARTLYTMLVKVTSHRSQRRHRRVLRVCRENIGMLTSPFCKVRSLRVHSQLVTLSGGGIISHRCTIHLLLFIEFAHYPLVLFIYPLPLGWCLRIRRARLA